MSYTITPAFDKWRDDHASQEWLSTILDSPRGQRLVAVLRELVALEQLRDTQAKPGADLIHQMAIRHAHVGGCQSILNLLPYLADCAVPPPVSFEGREWAHIAVSTPGAKPPPGVKAPRKNAASRKNQ